MKFNKKQWEDMEHGIKEREKKKKEMYGFACLVSATSLTNDIGDEVYFVSGNTVLKGVVVSVNCASMYGIQRIPDNDVTHYIASSDIYANVRYALKQAEYIQHERDNPKTKWEFQNI